MKLKDIFIQSSVDLWWRRSVMLMLNISLLSVLIFELPLTILLMLRIILILVAMMAFIGLSYFVSDFFQLKAYQKNGRVNRLYGTSIRVKGGSFITLLLLTIVPWFFLKFNFLATLVFCSQTLLLLTYVLPFPLLRKVPIVSTLVRTLYEYALPAIIVYIITVDVKTDAQIELWHFSLLLWVLILGIRFNLIDEIRSISFNKKENQLSTVELLGTGRTKTLFAFLLIVEFVLFLASIILMFDFTYTALFIILSCILVVSMTALLISNRNDASYFVLNEYRFIYDKFYQLYLPFILVGLLTFYLDARWAISILFVIPFFFKNIFEFLRQSISILVNIGYKVLHRLISAVLLIFGVNLKERNQTVLEFFKLKGGKK